MNGDTLYDVDKMHKQCKTISHRQSWDFGFIAIIQVSIKVYNKSKEVGEVNGQNWRLALFSRF